jgi:MFS superfamily sulfate permease-like transporter
LTGVIQLLAGFLKLGNITRYFPQSVIKGMLVGIGLIIILKQIPHAVGYNFEFKDDFDFDQLDGKNTLSQLRHMLPLITVGAIAIASLSMFILLLWDEYLTKKYARLKAIPGPLLVVIAGILLGNFFTLAESQMVRIPVAASLGDFIGQFTSPDFTQLKNPDIYGIALVMAIVASLETLLCLDATDRLDPKQRKTPTNRELKAQGIGNIVSGLIGGLPITQVVVRSSANISFGAQSKISTIAHGFLLLISAIAIPHLLNLIPLASLACILLAVGYKLAKPAIFREIYALGLRQFLPFIATILGMIFINLLFGVGLGVAVSVGLSLFHKFRK